MLILFDIDGTLLVTRGEGIGAMLDAGREMFGPSFDLDGVEFSGRLDPLIWNDLAKRNRIPDPQSHHDTFRKTYHRRLTAKLQLGEFCSLLPGVCELVGQLHKLDQVTLGLLTGNYPETGRMKIQIAGLDPDVFLISAWGCDGDTRRDLPPIAVKQYSKQTGRNLPFNQVIIIGDTPNDIDCAQANGCRSIGVATGKFTMDELHDAGGDLVLENLRESSRVINWLCQPVS